MTWYKHTPTVQNTHTGNHTYPQTAGEDNNPPAILLLQSHFKSSAGTCGIQQKQNIWGLRVFKLPNELWFPSKAVLISKPSFRIPAGPSAQQRFKGRQGRNRQTRRQNNKPNFLQAKQWPKSISKNKRRNICPWLYLIKIKMMIFGETSVSQQCSRTWVILGMLNLGTNGTNAAWETLSPPAPPWERHRTPPAAGTIHQELLNWWSFGSCTNCCWFFQGKILPEVKCSWKEPWEMMKSKQEKGLGGG